MSAKIILFEVFAWKYKNKSFSLRAGMEIRNGFPSGAWSDYYSIDFFCGKKILSRYTGKRLSGYRDRYFDCFKNLLANHPEAQQAWLSFDTEKVNLQSFKVIAII